MTTIQEIMESVYSSQFAASAYEASSGPGTKGLEVAMFAADGEVQALITQAIAEARAEGAMEEAQRIFPCCGGNDESPAEHTMDCPDKREPVRLTDAEIVALVVDGFGAATNDWASHIEFAREIETAVLAANGLTT